MAPPLNWDWPINPWCNKSERISTSSLPVFVTWMRSRGRSGTLRTEQAGGTEPKRLYKREMNALWLKHSTAGDLKHRHNRFVESRPCSTYEARAPPTSTTLWPSAGNQSGVMAIAGPAAPALPAWWQILDGGWGKSQQAKQEKWHDG